MAKPRRSQEEAVSLFPFLSILACVIGALTLVISAVTMSNIQQGRADEDIRLAEDFVSLQTQEKKLRDDLTAERKALGLSASLHEEITTLETRIAQLKTSLAKQKADQASRQAAADRINQEIDRLTAARDRKAIEIELSEKEKAKLEAELAKRQAPPPPPPLMILPGGDGRGKSPDAFRFVEATKNGILLHEGTGGKKPKLIPHAKIPTDATWRDLVQRSKGQDKTVVFLIREDAVPVWYQAKKVADAEQARVGNLPLVGDGPVDLTRFRAAFKSRGNR